MMGWGGEGLGARVGVMGPFENLVTTLTPPSLPLTRACV